MKYSFIFAFLLCWSITNAQTTTTYEIDYSYDVGLGAGCNVFSSEKTLSGFKHQATKGFPTYIVNSHIGSHINLACKRNSSSSQTGTDYQILFPFKKDHSYQIYVTYKGTFSVGVEPPPLIGLKMNASPKDHNTSVSCSGPQLIDIGQYEGQAAAGQNFVMPNTPILNKGPLTQNFESLSVASLTTQSSSATQPQGIQVRTIKIVEVAPTPTVLNDDYTGAINLIPNAHTPINGTTNNATLSSQARPSCYNPTQYEMTKDVWYKFIATSSTHTLNVTNVNFFGNTLGTPYAAFALYNSSLDVLNCFSNGMSTFTNLTIGQTYYIRMWAANINSNMTMDFDVALTSNGPTAITGISMSSYIFTASYQLDPSIPMSDITFEWSVLPGEIEPASDYTVEQWQGPHQIIVIAGEDQGDTSVRVKVRMKRISTNEILTDWYAHSSLTWF